MSTSPRPLERAGGLAFAFPNGSVAPRVSQAILVLALLVGGAAAVDAARIYDPSILPRARFVAPIAPYPGASYRAKDFSVIKKGDWYHLFYTRVQRFVPPHWSDGTRTILNETSLGHAMSPDLETWFVVDTVLTVSQVPGAWDEHHVWAPTLVEHDGVTWMLYTAVRDLKDSPSPTGWIPRWQVIAAAYSTDPLLRTWVRYFDPVWAPCAGPGMPGVSWALCSPLAELVNSISTIPPFTDAGTEKVGCLADPVSSAPSARLSAQISRDWLALGRPGAWPALGGAAVTEAIW